MRKKEQTSKEWSAGDAAQKAKAAEPPSARSGAPSSAAPMEVEAEACTPEELERARKAALGVRASLCMTYNQVLDMIGSCGLAFKKPQPADVSAAPAVAAVPSEAPPEDLLKYDIFTNSSGQHYAQLGHLQGWAGIVEEFDLSTHCMAHTGFDSDMQSFSGTSPTEWESWRCLWWDPISITPEG